MPANVESLFYVDIDGRNKPWHGMGLRIEDAPTSEDAIVAAGLDWQVLQAEDFYTVNGVNIPTGNIVNYRDSDNRYLGTVSERYKIVQNKDAFAFTDNLIDSGEVKYETAGSLNQGRVVWMLARMPEFDVLGDKMESYLLFSNSHDGTQSVRCAITNVRVVCQNTLNIALGSAKRSWSFVHKGDIDSKIEEARATLQLAQNYNNDFVAHADYLANKKISREQLIDILAKVFPVDEDVSKTRANHIIQLHENFKTCYNADDLGYIRGTAWGVLNAFSDMIYHGKASLRKTDTYQEKQMLSVINGNRIFDKAHTLLMAA